MQIRLSRAASTKLPKMTYHQVTSLRQNRASQFMVASVVPQNFPTPIEYQIKNENLNHSLPSYSNSDHFKSFPLAVGVIGAGIFIGVTYWLSSNEKKVAQNSHEVPSGQSATTGHRSKELANIVLSNKKIQRILASHPRIVR